MSPNIEAGEKLQLLVGSNVWKKSKLLDDDVAAAGTPLPSTVALTTLTLRSLPAPPCPVLLFWRRHSSVPSVMWTEKDHAKCDRTGCLITEVVFPGFHWEDHKFMSRDDLERLWGGKSGWEEWVPFIRSE
jgi:predicted cupin superfamily sugar epimerase